jgi:hypothetical protein
VFRKKLAERKDIQDALQRLDKLTQEEARRLAAGVPQTAPQNIVGDQVQGLDDTADNRAGGVVVKAVIVPDTVNVVERS